MLHEDSDSECGPCVRRNAKGRTRVLLRSRLAHNLNQRSAHIRVLRCGLVAKEQFDITPIGEHHVIGGMPLLHETPNPNKRFHFVIGHGHPTRCHHFNSADVCIQASLLQHCAQSVIAFHACNLHVAILQDGITRLRVPRINGQNRSHIPPPARCSALRARSSSSYVDLARSSNAFALALNPLLRIA